MVKMVVKAFGAPLSARDTNFFSNFLAPLRRFERQTPPIQINRDLSDACRDVMAGR
jgi:hypothetical protein